MRAHRTLLRTEFLALKVWVPKRGNPSWGSFPPNSSAFSAAGQKGVWCTRVLVFWMALAENSSLEKSGLRWFIVYSPFPVCVALDRSQCSHL